MRKLTAHGDEEIECAVNNLSREAGDVYMHPKVFMKLRKMSCFDPCRRRVLLMTGYMGTFRNKGEEAEIWLDRSLQEGEIAIKNTDL